MDQILLLKTQQYYLIPKVFDPPKGGLPKHKNQKSRKSFDLQDFAERGGFEPPIRFWRIHAFQACLLSHSSTSPDVYRLHRLLNSGAKIRVLFDMRKFLGEYFVALSDVPLFFRTFAQSESPFCGSIGLFRLLQLYIYIDYAEPATYTH